MTEKQPDLDKQEQVFAMTANQKSLSGGDAKSLMKKYRDLVCGDSSVLYWISYELYVLLIAPLPSILGFGLRKLFTPLLLGSCKSGPLVSSGVVFRNPQKISFGRNIVVDRNVVLDARNVSEFESFGVQCDDNVFIGNGSMILAKGGSIILSKAVNISSGCRIASEGKIEIGESSLVSAYCYIGPGNHNFLDKNVPIMEQGMTEGKGVKIGKNVWIGARVTILDGVTIGDNSIIGAHSFVREDVEENSVVAGTPARFIKNR